MSKVVRICFVCLGNIVRSPLAENMFLHFAKEMGVSQKYEADSAGTSAWHIGEKPDSRMRRVAAQYGFKYDGRARQFRQEDFEHFDLIIPMDINNKEDLQRMTRSTENSNKIHLLREFDPLGGLNSSVPDPYYGGISGFEEVYKVVERSCQGLLSALENSAFFDLDE